MKTFNVHTEDTYLIFISLDELMEANERAEREQADEYESYLHDLQEQLEDRAEQDYEEAMREEAYWELSSKGV